MWWKPSPPFVRHVRHTEALSTLPISRFAPAGVTYSDQYAHVCECGNIRVQKRAANGPILNVPRACVRVEVNRLNFQPVEVMVNGLVSERSAHTHEVLLDPSGGLGWLPGRFGCWLLAPLDRSHRHNRLAAGVYPEWQAHPAQHLNLLGFDLAACERNKLVLGEEHVRHEGLLNS